MKSYILGISAFYHDSAACLLKNGKPIVAVQEERFTRIKHDSSFPGKAIDYCLLSEGITIDDIELIVFYEKPFLKFDRIIDTYARKSPLGFFSFKKAMKSWVSEKLWIPSIIQKKLDFKGEILFTEHHEAHAASAFFSSPFNEAAILTIDGVGEHAALTLSIGKGNKITTLSEQRFPHSLGLFYSAITYYCGFKVNSGEYKLMGLAPYGNSIYKDLIYDNFVSVSDDGVVTLNMKYFDFEAGLKMTNNAFGKVFGAPSREPESEMTQFYKDVARSAQIVLEEIVVKLGKVAKEKTGLSNLCLAGGVALNCKANQVLLEEDIFDDIWVQPASGDSGGAMGAAYVGWYHYLNNPRVILDDSLIDNAYLGNEISNEQIEQQLKKFNLKFNHFTNELLVKQAAAYLNSKNIIGWFQGKMEFGPRALGARSILASPKFKDMQQYVNIKIKKREGFRPFAPIVMEDKANEWFEMSKPSKYMLFTYNVKQPDKIPSCTHVDNTARVQTVNGKENELMYNLLKEVNELSGIPILINTSFNVRGEPIVCGIDDAVRCLFDTEMDYLIIGNYIVSKEDNKEFNWSSIISQVAYELD